MKKQKNTFKEKVLKVIKRIKKGQVITYKEVAKLAGSPLAWRAVGNILKRNYDPKIPCHRVIRSDGRIGNYNRGIEKKKELLEQEGALLNLQNFKRKIKKFKKKN